MSIQVEGTLKKVNSKGFGFIEREEIDYFFHHTSFKGDWDRLLQRFVSRGPDEIIKVKFDNDPTGPSGPRAVNVELVEV